MSPELITATVLFLIAGGWLGLRLVRLERELAKLHHRLWNLERGVRSPAVEFEYHERAGAADAAAPPPRSPTPELEAQVRERLRAGRKIEAVKLWRAATGVGLKESVEAVERIGKG